MKTILRSVGRGFAGLLRFGGRDGRAAFWPYAVLVVFFHQIGMMTAMLPAIARIYRYVVTELEHAGTTGGPGDRSIAISSHAPDLGPVMPGMVGVMTLVTAITVALLAAAVARRLHDRDRSGYWGLLPIPFTAAGLALMPKFFTGALADPDAAEPWTMLALVLNNFAHLATLGVLIVLLAGPGTPGANRFGPPPA